MLASAVVSARLLAHLTLCTALMAFLPGLDLGAATAVDDCCADQRSDSDDREDGHSSRCPPGCDEGCACCASSSALPSPPPVLRALAAAVVCEARRTDREHDIERAPLEPEPGDRDAVPRAPAL